MMNLKKILTCAVALTIMTGNVTFAETNHQYRHISTSRANVQYEKLRFVKLTSDDRYDYYLDRESVKWKRVPYMSAEYMADVWIRMIERDAEQDNAVDVEENAELAFAREQNINYAPSDIEVLKHNQYFLEHYYLRPKRKQIQFLCELEVVGHPQNNEPGRAYDVKNWEELIPGSIESVLYKRVLKIIGDAQADASGHMKFTDWFEEITRVSIH